MTHTKDEKLPRTDVWMGTLASIIAWAQVLIPDQASSLPVVVWALLLPVESLSGLSVLIGPVASTGWNLGSDLVARVLSL
jgi:hypothetical protein